MKELSIAGKATRYDLAIEVAKKYHNGTLKDVMETIFPELKESEDERIRKSIIELLNEVHFTFKYYDINKMLAWLEKQQKPNPYSGTSFEYNGHTWGMCARDNGVEILIDGVLKGRVFTDDNNAKEMFIKALERVEEQNSKGYKLTDCDKNSWWEDFKSYTSCTIEQKPIFEMKTPEENLSIDSDTYNKIVDECIYGEQKPADKVESKFRVGEWIIHHGTENIYQVVAVIDNQYQLKYGDNYTTQYCEDVDRCARLWDIAKDAKDGDVLVSESTCGLGAWYCIFKSLDGDESMTVYCYLARDGRFETKKELCFDKDPYNTKPATKEQRDLLFQKMKEAGYEWDADKKELKKVEHTHAWSEEDERKKNKLIWIFEEIKKGANYFYGSDVKEIIDWLKSLRPQNTWKPSDEQMNMLAKFIEYFDVGLNGKEVLRSLYLDLEKLTE